MSIANYAENRILDALFNNTSLAIATPYVSLHTADPGEWVNLAEKKELEAIRGELSALIKTTEAGAKR